MSITDELRKHASEMAPHWEMGTLLAIADRIDERVTELLRKQDADLRAEFDLMNDGWVQLPKDADGEVIHVGDVMAYTDNTKPMEVLALVPPVIFLTEDGPRYADMCRHYHAPTVEDVLREFAEEYAHDELGVEQWLLDKYAQRLRLREDA